MEVDWFTVGAQLVNFFVLFALLSKFLYRPIVDAIDDREARIAGRLEEAERREEEAERERRHWEKKQREFEESRQERLERLDHEADERRRELLDELRDEVQRARDHWYGRLRSEQDRLLREFEGRLEKEVFETTRRVLRDLADVSAAEKVVDQFVRDLEAADLEVIDALRDELEHGDTPPVVRSSFELDDRRRSRLQSALSTLVDRELNAEFRVDEELVAGLELRAGSRRFGWNVRSYLGDLRDALRDALEAEPGIASARPPVSDALERTGA